MVEAATAKKKRSTSTSVHAGPGPAATSKPPVKRRRADTLTAKLEELAASYKPKLIKLWQAEELLKRRLTEATFLREDTERRLAKIEALLREGPEGEGGADVDPDEDPAGVGPEE